MSLELDRTARPPDAHEACAAFGLGRVVADPTIAARGELGRIWRLETTTGTWALKEVFRPTAETASLARADVAFQLAALTAGTPMPRPLVTAAGDALVEVGPEDHRRSVRMYSWLDLRDRSAVPALGSVAAILGRLHALAIRDDRVPDPWFSVPAPAATWPPLVAEAERAGVAWAGALAGLVPTLVAGAEIARDAARSTPPATITCHLDYNPENVLVDVRDRVVVIDWENSGPAQPEQELASAVAEFVVDPAETRSFLGAYAEAGGTGRLRDRTSFAMTLAVQANLVRGYARRALDTTANLEDRARAAHWVEDIAAHAFTTDRIDRWLEAAATSHR